MITPVNRLRTRLVVIEIHPSYWTIYRSFEISLEWEVTCNMNAKGQTWNENIRTMTRSNEKSLS